MSNLKMINRLYEIFDEVCAYQRVIGKMEYDQNCSCPPDGMEVAGRDSAILGRHLFQLLHQEETVGLICQLYENGKDLEPLQKKFVDNLYEDYLKTKNLTPEFAFEKDCAINEAYGKWLKAKKESDFSVFRDSLAKVVEFTIASIEKRDEKMETCYDTCLDDYEKGMSVKKADDFFLTLKRELIPFIKEIQEKGKKVRTDFLYRPCPIAAQEEISKYLLMQEGIRESAFVLDTTEHPFTTNFGPWDVRVATHYYEDNYVSNLFSILHEGGHALFMQFEPEEFVLAHVDNRMTNGMHECVSRFYENIVGRSEAFIHHCYPEIQESSNGLFSDISEREFYEAVNYVEPSLIRTEADELTYSLHILIRYEIEKALINREITVDQIPVLWNLKYKEYLGVDVPDDERGCLQDVHWTSDFGYFPSYAFGNAYGVQILKAMEKEFDVFTAIAEGQLWKITQWFKEKVFAKASILSPEQWMVELTGEPLNVNYYIEYLKEKYSKIYMK